jgi:hypothetical protein
VRAAAAMLPRYEEEKALFLKINEGLSARLTYVVFVLLDHYKIFGHANAFSDPEVAGTVSVDVRHG